MHSDFTKISSQTVKATKRDKLFLFVAMPHAAIAVSTVNGLFVPKILTLTLILSLDSKQGIYEQSGANSPVTLSTIICTVKRSQSLVDL